MAQSSRHNYNNKSFSQVEHIRNWSPCPVLPDIVMFAPGGVTWSKRKVTIRGLPVEVEQLVNEMLPTLSGKAN